MATANLPRSDFYVYVLFRHDTGQPFYVGKGRGQRISTTMRKDTSNFAKRRIISAASDVGADIPRVRVASNLSERIAFEIEAALISSIGRGTQGPLVNRTNGGEGGSGSVWTNDERREALRARNKARTQTPETRAKKSAAMKGKNVGRKHTEAALAKMRLASTGRRHTPDELRKMSSSQKGRSMSTEKRLHLSAVKSGKTQTEEQKIKRRETMARPETREKMRQARLGIKHSAETIAKLTGKVATPETRAKMSASQRGRIVSAETRANMVAAWRRRKCQV